MITSGVPVPLWWRSIPADYRTPLFQGIEVLPLNPDEGRTAQEQLDSVRSRTKRFLGLKPEDQELEVLRSVVRKEVERSRRQEGEAVQAAWKAALGRVESVKTSPPGDTEDNPFVFVDVFHQSRQGLAAIIVGAFLGARPDP